MNILFDLGHPFHVHYFRPAIDYLKKNGYQVCVLARDKDISHHLLDKFEIEFIDKGIGGKGIFDRILYTVKSLGILQKTIKNFDPDLCVSVASPYLALICKLNRIKHVMFNDTEKEFLFGQTVAFTRPELYLPDSFLNKERFRHYEIPSYLELAYLHPDIFKPDDEILKQTGKDFVLVRFVSDSASHDFGSRGISMNFKIRLIETIRTFKKVWVTSEEKLPAVLEPYRLEVSPEKIHDVVAHAKLVVGGSATMSSEAAILGVPSILICPNQWGYIRELCNKYKLVHYFKNDEKGRMEALEMVSRILSSDDTSIYSTRRRQLLSDKMNTTNLILEIIEKYKT